MLNVILSIDERIDDVKNCVDSLRSVYGQGVKIALATYGGRYVKEQPLIIKYAIQEGFPYYSCPRQDWLTDDDIREWHCCETLARLQITKALSHLDNEIYIMHADIEVLGNFRKHFLLPILKGSVYEMNWSFVAILLRAKEEFLTLCGKGSWKLFFEANSARLSDIVTLYNPVFVKILYETYKDDKGIWDNLLSKFTLFSDLAQFDLARDWNGFTGCFITDKDDDKPICHNTIQHLARQRIPAFLPSSVHQGGVLSDMISNYERRTGEKL